MHGHYAKFSAFIDEFFQTELQTQHQSICEELEKDSFFEDFLQEKHAEEYEGIKDNMSDAFEEWLGELGVDDFIKYSDEYRKQTLTQAIKKIKDK